MNIVSDTTSKPGSSGWQFALKASTAGQYLGDRAIVNGLVRHFSADICERYTAVCEGRSTPWDASTADRDECLRMAGVFSGKDSAYESMGDWNSGGGLGRYVAKLLEQSVAPSNLADPVQALTQAFAMFAHLVYAIVKRVNNEADLPVSQEHLSSLSDEMTNVLLGFSSEIFDG